MRVIIILFCLLFKSMTSYGQGLNVELVSINDNRGSSSFSRCELNLKLTGSLLQGAEFWKLDPQLQAFDDQNTNLVNDQSFGFRGDEFKKVELEENQEMELEINLSNPQRSAVEIKTVKGKVQLYNSSLDPKSKIIVKNFVNKANQSLLVQKYPDFDVFYYDKEAYQFMQQAEKEKVNKQIALLNPGDREQAQAFISSFFDMMKNGEGPNSVHFFVKQKKEQIFMFQFLDEDGKPAEPGSTFEANGFYSFGFRKPVTGNWQVILLLQTEKSIQSIPFELKGIKLP